MFVLIGASTGLWVCDCGCDWISGEAYMFSGDTAESRVSKDVREPDD